MQVDPDHDLDPSLLKQQTVADGSTEGVKRQLENLLIASLGDDSRTRQLTDVLLSDFNAAKTNAAIGSEYMGCTYDSYPPVPDDWDADGLQELAATGIVRAAVSALNSPTSKAAKESTASVVFHDHHRLMVYSLDGGVQQPRTIDVAIGELQQMAAGDEPCAWLDVTDPTADELLQLARAFDLHPLTVEDILAADTGDDKAEWIGQTLVVIYRALHMDPMGVCGVSMVVRQRLVMTFHGTAASAQVHETLVRLLGQQQQQQQQPGATGHAWFIAYALVDAVTDGLALAMRRVEEDVQAADALAMDTATQGDVGLRRIGEARRRLLGIWRVLMGKPEVARALAKEATGDLGHYLADVIDHLDALLALCVQCEAVLGRAHANYSARLALALAETSVGAGAFAGQWMVLAGVLLPMQFVAGLFGQNVWVPWKWDAEKKLHDNLHAWLGIMGSLALFFVVLIAVLRIRRTI